MSNSRTPVLLAALLFSGALPAPLAAAPPGAGRCPQLGARPAGGAAEDAGPPRIREGMRLGAEDLPRLQALLPRELWRLRDVFFFEGMQLEIGSCHRVYPPPGFFAEATGRFAGTARLDAEGNLWDHTAGLPFPPDSIDAGAGDAGARWAWNFERRYRGAGPNGRFRIADMPSRRAGPFTYHGSFFFLQTARRADLEATGFAVPGSGGALWIAGGRFAEPFSARHLAWRQLRPDDTERRYAAADDTFVYVPTMRKMRRAASGWVDGIYTPRYRATGDDGGGGIPVGAGRGGGVQGSIQPTAARSIAVTEALRAGFTGLALRPNAYVWKLVAEREVLAPLNATRAGYPVEPDRNFGPSGLSVASDRWDLRQAVVIAGLRREPGGEFQRLELWLDWQTQQPLYWIAKQSDGSLVEVLIPVHRYSGDLTHYPAWPGGGGAGVFDPVAAVSWSPQDDTGWRRESYDVVSVPPEPATVRRYISTDFLMRGR